jgi:hypothetical protein
VVLTDDAEDAEDVEVTVLLVVDTVELFVGDARALIDADCDTWLDPVMVRERDGDGVLGGVWVLGNESE